MKKCYELIGRYCILKSVSVEDAQFTLDIRHHPKAAGNMPCLNVTLDQQIDWIKKEQEDYGDYFFVIWDMKGNRIGTEGLYNIKGDTAESGRLIVIGNPLQSLEAQMLFGDFAFDTMGISVLKNYIYTENITALRNVKLFGGIPINESIDRNGRKITNVEITNNSFHACRPKLAKMIYRQS